MGDDMIRVIIVVRELGRAKPDYSLPFDLSEVPTVGSYISVNRPNVPEPYSEDLVVRKIWWRLHHPETGSFGSEPEKVGTLTEVFVECDPAIGPWSSDRWRDMLFAARERGVAVEDFDVSRLSIRQDALK